MRVIYYWVSSARLVNRVTLIMDGTLDSCEELEFLDFFFEALNRVETFANSLFMGSTSCDRTSKD